MPEETQPEIPTKPFVEDYRPYTVGAPGSIEALYAAAGEAKETK